MLLGLAGPSLWREGDGCKFILSWANLAGDLQLNRKEISLSHEPAYSAQYGTPVADDVGPAVRATKTLEE